MLAVKALPHPPCRGAELNIETGALSIACQSLICPGRGPSPKFPTATSALKACKHVMALQLAYEPRVLRQAREIYEESALVLVEVCW